MHNEIHDHARRLYRGTTVLRSVLLESLPSLFSPLPYFLPLSFGAIDRKQLLRSEGFHVGGIYGGHRKIPKVVPFEVKAPTMELRSRRDPNQGRFTGLAVRHERL